MHVFEDYGPQCYAAQPLRVFLENNNTIIFTNEDMEVAFPDYRRLLYLEGQINDVFIGELWLTLVPLSTFFPWQCSL